MSLQTISIVATITLAFLGYFATYINNLLLSKRKERLELVNQRIAELYGPLFVAVVTSRRAFEALLIKLGRSPGLEKPLSEEEIKEYKVWLEAVFMPNNLEIAKLITQKAYLIQEEEIPNAVLDFITHVSGYKAVMRKWAMNDFTEYGSVIGFPKDFEYYAVQSYKHLKTLQLRLIGSKASYFNG